MSTSASTPIVNPVDAAAATAAAPASAAKTKGIVGYFLMISGVIIIIVSYGVHFATISYGTSGSDFVASKLSTPLGTLISGVTVLFVGFVVWIWSGLNSEYRFFGLFILCLLSLISCNAALYFSLIQVTVTPR